MSQGGYIQTGTLRPPHGDASPLGHAHVMATTVAAQAGASTPTRHPPGRHTLRSEGASPAREAERGAVELATTPDTRVGLAQR
eukprot:6184392-Pleurochrysis_carterae.AAC.1